MWPFLSPRIVYEVLYRTGTIVISSCMTLGRDNTEIHDLCPIEMSNEAINGLNRIFWSFGAFLPPLMRGAESGKNVVYAPTQGLYTIGSLRFSRQFLSCTGRKRPFLGSEYMRGTAKMGVKILHFEKIFHIRSKPNDFSLRWKKLELITCKISPTIKPNVRILIFGVCTPIQHGRLVVKLVYYFGKRLQSVSWTQTGKTYVETYQWFPTP